MPNPLRPGEFLPGDASSTPSPPSSGPRVSHVITVTAHADSPHLALPSHLTLAERRVLSHQKAFPVLLCPQDKVLTPRRITKHLGCTHVWQVLPGWSAGFRPRRPLPGSLLPYHGASATPGSHSGLPSPAPSFPNTS